MAPIARARWADFEPAFADAARAEHPGLTPQGLALALRFWGRVHGLVALEVYGHLPPQLRERDKHFRDEMRELGETCAPSCWLRQRPDRANLRQELAESHPFPARSGVRRLR